MKECKAMPPKFKFSKDEILQNALDLVREEGATALTTRRLGKRLGTTQSPIFSAYENVEALQADVKQAAKELFASYVRRGLEDKPAFKGVSKQYILFAKNEPNLFRWLFMSKDMIADTKQYNPIITDNYKTVYAAFRDTYSLTDEETDKMYIHIGIYLHGLATLFAEQMCDYSIEQVGELMTELGKSLLARIKQYN